MFKENLKKLRKQKGMSQEVLAQQMNVVRQTISKWEKGYSVPDAQMLIQLAELFEVPVSDLLGAEVKTETNQNEVAVQLAILNEQLANHTRSKKKWIKGTLIAFAAIVLIFLFTVFRKFSFITITANPTLSKETVTYKMVLYGDDQDIWYGGDDEWIGEKVVEPYIARFGKHYKGSLLPLIYQFMEESHYKNIHCEVKGYLSGYDISTYIYQMKTEYDQEFN